MSGTAANHSETGGVKAMSIAGRTVSDRERIHGMNNEERAWRRKWLLDQNLTPREPVTFSRYDHDLMNPIRRAYRKPLDLLFFKVLQPIIGKVPAEVSRFYTGKILMGLWIGYFTYYYFKYNTNNWERTGGWRVIQTRAAVLPGDPGYPAGQEKSKGADYADRGFSKSMFAQNTPKLEECAPTEKTSRFHF